MKYDMRLMAERVSYLLRLTDRLDNPAEMSDDGAGFNQPDAVFFRDLYLSEQNIAEVAWRLKKYQGQLEAAELWGDDMEIVREITAKEKEDTIRITNQFVRDNKLFFSFKAAYGSPKFVEFKDWIKSIGGRWDGSSWSLSANSALGNKEKLEFYGLNLSKLGMESEKTVERQAKKFAMRIEGNYLIIEHEFDSAMNELYKARGGFRWEPSDKTRRFYIAEGTEPKAWSIAEALMKANYLPKDDITQGVILFLQTKTKGLEERIAAKTDFKAEIPELDKLLKLKLSPYQIAGVKFADLAGGRCIIGDEMGLGKTAQAIAYAVWKNMPALVVCPKRVKVSWEDDIQKFTDKSFQIISNKNDVLSGAFFTVVHYDIVWKKDFSQLKHQLLIVDESHYIKERETKRAIGVKEISERSKAVLLLSGTPVVNRPRELLNQIFTCRPNFIAPMYYLNKFCDPKTIHIARGKTATDYSGASNLPELFERLGPIYLRREKKDVLKELPPKIHQDIKLDIDLPKLEEAGSVVGMYSRVKKAMAEAKAPETAEFVSEMLEQGVSVILFSSHPQAIATFERHFVEKNQPYLSIVAGMTDEETRDTVREFQNGEKYKLILVSLECGAEGINLFKASHVVFNDLHWTPGKNQQAEDRAHRRGQQNTVNVYRMIGIESEPLLYRENEKGKLVPIHFDVYLKETIMKKAQIQAIINTGRAVPEEQLRYLEMTLDECAKKDGLRFK